MELNSQRLWFNLNIILDGYRAYYQVCNERLKEDQIDLAEEIVLEQNLCIYEQYLRRLERMKEELHNQNTKKPASSLSANSCTKLDAMGAELDGMIGRLRIDVQAVVGFARLAQGDLFEVSLRHGQQKWKCRGKTLSDKSQRWEPNPQHHFTCYPDQPLIVKVTEVRLLRSKTLSERSFQPTQFFAPQALLVTMNLNAIGSLKLKMVIAWMPLMTSKALPASIEDAQKSPTLSYHNTATNKTLTSSSTITMPLSRMSGIDDDAVSRSAITLNGTLARDSTLTQMSPPKVCLREKKRQSRSHGPPKDEKNWRSSTNILDSVYKDLSRSIPTIDDLTVFGNAPLHRQMHSATDAPGIRPAQPQMGLKASVSAHHLATRPLPQTRSNVYCNTNVLRPSAESSKEVSPNSLVVESRGRKSTDSDDSSGVSSLGANGSVGRRSNVTSRCEKVDSLLQCIEKIRSILVPLRSSEFPEVVSFEASMLNWEAALKLNRALFVESSRAGSLSAQRHPANRLMKRASMYSIQQPSPPSTLSSEDSNDRNGNVAGDHNIFENDSGIDSLRQPVSPYNRQRPFPPHGVYMNGNVNGVSRCPTITMVGPAQRRFNKHIQERKRRSLGGWILDDPMECERWLNLMNGGVDQNGGKARVQMATGHSELDLCLQHHLNGALNDLEELGQIRGPLEYRMNELLNRIEQNTVALEEMLRIGDALPAWPNVTNLLSDLDADWDQQEIWLSTCYSQNASIIVPAERLRLNLHAAVVPIVKKAQYPKLINRVVDTLMANLQQDPSDPSKFDHYVSIFEFASLFSGKQFGSYVENLAHEAFITTSLESQQIGTIREIMERLRHVPVIPPMDSLKHIGLVLNSNDSQESSIFAIEHYFRSASNEMQQDLTLSFMNLLEAKCPRTRQGACKALAILRSEDSMNALSFVASEDYDPSVREEARRAFDRIHCYFEEYQEVTKI